MKIIPFTTLISCILLTNGQETDECYEQGPCNEGFMDKTNDQYLQLTYCSGCEGGEYYLNSDCDCACIPSDGCEASESIFTGMSTGEYIGAGIGFGLLGSIFVFVGLRLFPLTRAWTGVDATNETGKCTLCFMPCLLVPVLLYLSTWCFVIPLVGYGVPFTFLIMRKRVFTRQNPRRRRQADGAQLVPAVVEPTALGLTRMNKSLKVHPSPTSEIQVEGGSPGVSPVGVDSATVASPNELWSNPRPVNVSQPLPLYANEGYCREPSLNNQIPEYPFNV